MKKETLQEAGKVLAVCLTFSIGFIFIFLFLTPDSKYGLGEWLTRLTGALTFGALMIYVSFRLYRRWENTGWIKKHKDWVEEADRMPNPLNNGDKE